MFGTLQRSAAAIALFPEPANRWLDERLWIALLLIGVLCGAQAAGRLVRLSLSVCAHLDRAKKIIDLKAPSSLQAWQRFG
jgi:hypothetical protein